MSSPGTGSFADADASCPAGTVALGGGARTFGIIARTSDEVVITGSYPTPIGATPRTGWHAQAQQITGGTDVWSIEATVICA